MVSSSLRILNSRQNCHKPSIPGTSSPVGTWSLINDDTGKLKAKAEEMAQRVECMLWKCEDARWPSLVLTQAAVPASASWRQDPWGKLPG